MSAEVIPFRYADARLPARFWKKVACIPTGCWEWRAAATRGYGVYAVERRAQRAHRVAFEALVGPIPEGMDLDHLCRNPSCVNPAHLEVVTHRENVLRGESPPAELARRTRCPEGHPLAGANLSPSSTRRGSRSCLTCERRRSREQAELVKRAARQLGLGIDTYKAAYGQGRATARALLGGAEAMVEAS